MRRRRTAQAGDNTLLGTLGGAALGGFIGNQFGHGAGSAVGTGVSVFIGGLIGNSVGRSMDYPVPITRAVIQAIRLIRPIRIRTEADVCCAARTAAAPRRLCGARSGRIPLCLAGHCRGGYVGTSSNSSRYCREYTQQVRIGNGFKKPMARPAFVRTEAGISSVKVNEFGRRASEENPGEPDVRSPGFF